MKPASRRSRPGHAGWRAGLRCWIELDGKVVLGAGRADLLEHIDRTHSIRQAAVRMKMSYRRAWLLVQSMNEGAGEPVVLTETGGRNGGQSIVTPRGREFVEFFRRLQRVLGQTADELSESLAGSRGFRKPSLRKRKT